MLWLVPETKFALGSAAKMVSVCWYEEKQNWWISRPIQKHTSTVLAVAWHPNGYVLATGSTDYRCRIVVHAQKGVDKRYVCGAPTPHSR